MNRELPLIEAARPTLQVDDRIVQDDVSTLQERYEDRLLKSVSWFKHPTIKLMKNKIAGTIDTRYGILYDNRIVGQFFLEPTQHRFLVTPHTAILRQYRGKGIAKSVYSATLNTGQYCFGSGEHQSKAANILWSKLASTYEWFLVNVKGSSEFLGFGSIQYLGQSVNSKILYSPYTRIIMLGRGWTINRFQSKTGMIMP